MKEKVGILGTLIAKSIIVMKNTNKVICCTMPILNIIFMQFIQYAINFILL